MPRTLYDWKVVQAYHDQGHGFVECSRQFGFCHTAWIKAIKRGALLVSPSRFSDRRGNQDPPNWHADIAELLPNPKRSRAHVKRRLVSARLLENRCRRCGIDAWFGQPLSMHLDHVNGVGNDNRLENLRMLCPNCHSQTPTYGGRNAKLRRLQEPVPPM
jgi:HNH endonuclease